MHSLGENSWSARAPMVRSRLACSTDANAYTAHPGFKHPRVGMQLTHAGTAHPCESVQALGCQATDARVWQPAPLPHLGDGNDLRGGYRADGGGALEARGHGAKERAAHHLPGAQGGQANAGGVHDLGRQGGSGGGADGGGQLGLLRAHAAGLARGAHPCMGPWLASAA
jgi:hypothetical protein